MRSSRTRRFRLRITFHGAAGSVTGSRHLLEAGGRRLLLDCGLVQGRRSESDRMNRNPGIDFDSIDAILLSHAHIDHAGSIPSAVRRGFAGPVYSTPATRDLCSIMLADSARIQVADAEFLNRMEGRRGRRIEPLYTPDDAMESMELFHTVPCGREFEPFEGIRVRFLEAGHILGSAQILLSCREGGRAVEILYSGDLGRSGMPIVMDPDLSPRPDFLVMESTYGDRLHETHEDSAGRLAAILDSTFSRRGRVLIPAFSVGRTQDILYYIRRLYESGMVEPAPVFVDSPLSTDATEIYRMHPECFDSETRRLVDREEGPFSFRQLRFIRTVEGSKALNGIREPMIVISASGMCEHGRILHHLRNCLGNPSDTVLLVGFMAEGTLGRRLAEGADRVRIFDEEFEVRAAVERIEGFSAHADSAGLYRYAATAGAAAGLIVLVHGEPAQSAALCDRIREGTGRMCAVPSRGDVLDLGPLPGNSGRGRG